MAINIYGPLISLNMLHNFSPAAERNKQPILDYLQQWLTDDNHILEIGSGSGQHGIFFAQQLPNITWQCSDRGGHLPALTKNINNASLANLLPPIELDVMQYDWASEQYDIIFTANTLHIMTLDEVKHFLQHCHLALKLHGQLIVYGPFKYHDKFTSDSNQQFDAMLRQRNAGSCIKAFDTVDTILRKNSFILKHDVAMPANNQLLCWQLE